MALQLSGVLELQQHSNQAIDRIEDQRMERALGSRAVGGGIFFLWQLKEGVELNRRTTAPRVLDDQAAGMDVAGAGERRPDGRTAGRSVQHPKISITELGTSV